MLILFEDSSEDMVYLSALWLADRGICMISVSMCQNMPPTGLLIWKWQSKRGGKRQSIPLTELLWLWYRHPNFLMSLCWQDQVLAVLLKVEINLWSIILNCLQYWLFLFSSVPASARTRFPVIKTIHTHHSKVLIKPLIKSFLCCHFH